MTGTAHIYEAYHDLVVALCGGQRIGRWTRCRAIKLRYLAPGRQDRVW